MAVIGEVLDLNKLVITNHAVERFMARIGNMGTPKEPEKTIRKLLARATEDNYMDSVTRVKRLLNHHVIPAIYLIDSGWRFVVVKEKNRFILVTVERSF